MALALLHAAQIDNGQVVDADDLKDNFNQLINLLNGTSNNVDAIIKLSSATLAPLLLNQLNAAGPVQIWQLNSVDKLKVNNLAQLESLLATGTAPLVVASTTKVTNLNADLLDDLTSADFGKIGISKIPFSANFRVDDAGSYPINDDTVLVLVKIPAVNTAFITKITIIRHSGTHTGGTSVTFGARVFGGGAIGVGVSFNDSNNAQDTPYSEDFADVQVFEGNYIGFRITAKTGTPTEARIDVCVEGYQTLKV